MLIAAKSRRATGPSSGALFDLEQDICKKVYCQIDESMKPIKSSDAGYAYHCCFDTYGANKQLSSFIRSFLALQMIQSVTRQAEPLRETAMLLIHDSMLPHGLMLLLRTQEEKPVSLCISAMRLTQAVCGKQGLPLPSIASRR